MYEVFLDAPPLLYFRSSGVSDYVAVDVAQHSAVINSSIVDPDGWFIRAKPCRGTCQAAFERRNLR